MQQHAELVAAESGDHVALARGAAEPGGDRPQQLVAALVAESVVDVLEVVQVDEQHRVASGAAFARPLDRVEEQHPVRQPGQRVVQCFVFGQPPGQDVCEARDQQESGVNDGPLPWVLGHARHQVVVVDRVGDR